MDLHGANNVYISGSSLLVSSASSVLLKTLLLFPFEAFGLLSVPCLRGLDFLSPLNFGLSRDPSYRERNDVDGFAGISSKRRATNDFLPPGTYGPSVVPPHVPSRKYISATPFQLALYT